MTPKFTPQRLVDPATSAGAAPVPETSPTCRASPGQQQIWLFEQLVPGVPFHVNALLATVRGELDLLALERAVVDVTARHPSLQATFHAVDGELWVRYDSGPRRVFTAVDVRTSGAPAAHGHVHAALDDIVDTRIGPLFRVLLLRLADDEWWILLAVHHLIADGESLAILQSDLVDAYQDQVLRGSGEPGGTGHLTAPAPSSPVPGPEADPEEVEDARRYWRSALADPPEPLDLSGASDVAVGRASADYRGDSLPLTVPPHVAQTVGTLARAESATPFMVHLSVLAALLHRWSGASDVIVGAPVAGRLDAGSEAEVGHFVNMLPLRLRIDPDPTLRALLRQARQVCLDGYENQVVPFHEILREAAPSRQLGTHPLFQVVLGQLLPLEVPRSAAGATFSFDRVHPRYALYDLEWQVSPDGRSAGYLTYRTGAIGRRLAVQLLNDFGRLLADWVAAPDRALSTLPRLTPDMRDDIVHTQWDTRRDYPRDASLPELFATCARSDPQARAVIGATRTWTYRELDEESTRWAYTLRERGVVAEDRVGLCLTPGPSWIIAAMAVVKLGAAYLPLDPVYPVERLGFMARDAHPRLVVVDDDTERLLGTLDGLEVTLVAVESLTSCDVTVDNGGKEGELPTVPPQALAYVMYTSGSTGTPKGIEVSHRNVTRLVRSVSYVNLGSDDVVAQTSNLSFDAATFEIWGALLNGAALAIAPPSAPTDVDVLLDFVRQRVVTTLFLTTSLAMQVIGMRPDVVRPLRTLVFGGEQPSLHAVRTCLESGISTRLVNGYGPTETTTFAAAYNCRDLPALARVVPMGTPLENTQLYVLDDYLEPVPNDVVGQLYIGGDGVARGYHRRPGLTADRFVPDHLGPVPGGRLYSTGDRVRRRVDGTFEFLGRLDRQVKVRGYRVEPAEVEAVLDASGLITRTLVRVEPDPEGECRLVCYFESASSSVDERTVRRHLEDHLPRYLVPSVLVPLAAFSFTANGKLDEDALPRLSMPSAEPRQRQLTDTEERLLRIWSDVLGRPGLDVDDDFFAVGGHSLMVHRIVAGTRTAFGLDVPFRVLYESPTVADFAREVDAVAQRADGDRAPARIVEPGAGAMPPSDDGDREDAHDSEDIVGLLRLIRHLPDDELDHLLDETARGHRAN
jgi:amino acid adenylation domain-containing protein